MQCTILLSVKKKKEKNRDHEEEGKCVAYHLIACTASHQCSEMVSYDFLFFIKIITLSEVVVYNEGVTASRATLRRRLLILLRRCRLMRRSASVIRFH